MGTTDDGPNLHHLSDRIDALEQRLEAIEPDRAVPGVETELICAVPEPSPRDLEPGISVERARLIQYAARKWVNETVLHYYFFDDGPFGGAEIQKNIVREGFDVWRDVGIGLTFEEVDRIADAEVRIGFLAGDGYWSYLGTDVLQIGQQERTMNFGSDLTRDRRGVDVPVHEIGHTLGFPHEHQNPLAGIVWDEPAVHDTFSGPPNNWTPEMIERNILRKIPTGEVEGSDWDRDSIMHYAFQAGLIKVPAEFRTEPLIPDPGLSEADKEQALFFYPASQPTPVLQPFESVRIDLEPGRQANFAIEPDATRTYTIQTFGYTDSVIVLFEDVDGDHVFVAGDDDSGWSRNARLQLRLYAGRRYVLRVRLYYHWSSGEMAVMVY